MDRVRPRDVSYGPEDRAGGRWVSDLDLLDEGDW
jgi:hypothetical protein